MHGGLCRGMLGLNRRSNYVSKLRSQPLFAALPSRRWLSSPELLDDVCKRTARFCQNFQHVRNPAVQVHLRGKAEGGGRCQSAHGKNILDPFDRDPYSCCWSRRSVRWCCST